MDEMIRDPRQVTALNGDETRFVASAFLHLLWKEWREQGSNMLLGVFLVAGFTGIALTARLIPDDAVLTISVFIGGIVFPILTAMSVIAPQRDEGSLAMLLRLPAPSAMVLAAKTLIAAAIVAVPLLAGLAVFLAMAAGRELTVAQITPRYVGGIVMGWNVLLWTLCPTAGWRSEALVALFGAAVLLVFFMVMSIFGTGDAVMRWTPYSMIRPNLTWSWLGKLLWPQAIIDAGLWCWAWYRLERLARREG